MKKENRKVRILLKVNKGHLSRLGKGVEAGEVLYRNNRIGSAFAPNSKDVLRGLTFEEEQKLLPSVIGVSPEDNNWLHATANYWKNISLDIPYSYMDNQEDNGVELEVGFYYKNEEDRKIALAEENAEWNKYRAERDAGRFYKMKFDKRIEKGTPINVADFIMYRYCLVYPRVANTKEERNNSPKIRFYLESSAQRTAERSAKHEFNIKVTKTYIELISDRDKVGNLMYILSSEKDQVERKKGEEYNTNTPSETDIFLKAYSDIYPERFMELVNDKRLKRKAFIQRAIDSGILRRIPNTQTIMFEDDTVIGDSMNEACDYLTLDKNKGVTNEIKQRLKALE